MKKEKLEPELEEYNFPAEGVTIKARSQDEALSKLKELQKAP